MPTQGRSPVKDAAPEVEDYSRREGNRTVCGAVRGGTPVQTSLEGERGNVA